MFADSDDQWRAYGRQDPYFGVLSDERFRRASMTDTVRDEFFASGEQHIDWTWKLVEDHFGRPFAPQRALDFGCGVGRLLIPLARRSVVAHGADVSEGMLAEAKKNCVSYAAGNVELFMSGDSLQALPSGYDFINSYIVFQHIPPVRGETLFVQLLGKLNPGGIATVHFTFESPLKQRILRFSRQYIPLCGLTLNLLKKRKANAPVMEMYTYRLERLLKQAYRQGVEDLVLRLVDHGGHLGAMLFLRKGESGSGRVAGLHGV